MSASPPRRGSSAQRLARHWFLPGLALAAGLGLLAPELGVRGGPLRPEITTRVAVAAIFFLQGLALAPTVLRAGALRWRLHTAVQLFIFVAFPAAALLLDHLFGAALTAELRLGFLFLAILPTTISGCVVLTAAAGGNVAGAMFNAVLANTAGVVLTPLWAALLLGVRGAHTPFLPMIGDVALLLLVPLAAGQAVRPLVLRHREPDRAAIMQAANAIILYIVFIAFAGSAATDAFARVGVTSTLLLACFALLLFAAATAAAIGVGRALRFDRGDRIALQFCAPQKTLAAGAPMAQVLFATHPGLGLILLPLLAYHAIQLLLGALLVEAAAGSAHPPASAATAGSNAGATHTGATGAPTPAAASAAPGPAAPRPSATPQSGRQARGGPL